jgi:hypothetical protein
MHETTVANFIFKIDAIEFLGAMGKNPTDKVKSIGCQLKAVS